MKVFLSLLLLVAATIVPVYGDDVKPETKPAVAAKVGANLKFPQLPRKPTPKQESEIVTLNTGVFYVIESPTPFEVGAVEIEAVNIIRADAPLSFGGVFVDSKDGKSEIRSYKTGHIAIIQASSITPALTTLIVAPEGAKGTEWIYVKIKVGQGPIPPPPNPTPTPTPTPDVIPTPTVDPNALKVPDGFRVIFISESGAKPTKDQYNTLNSPDIIAYLNSKCVKNAAGTNSEWRSFDPDVDISKEPSEAIRKIWTLVKPELAKNPLPQLLICVNGSGYLSAWPAGPAAMLDRLKLKGGN